jgi:hypothetical protein
MSYIQDFNKAISVDQVLHVTGGYPTQYAICFLYKGQYVHSEYAIPLSNGHYSKLDVNIDATAANTLIMICRFNEQITGIYTDTFGLYVELLCNKDEQMAMGWRTDARLHALPTYQQPTFPIPAPVFQQQQNYSEQTYDNYRQQTYQSSPLIDIDTALDSVGCEHYMRLEDNTVDLTI